MKIGILPLARSTFDTEFAAQKLAVMLQKLERSGHQIIGARELLFDEAATRQALHELRGQACEHLLLLQVTFTDASMAVTVAAEMALPISIWAVPEPRIGGRLRLNSFCGLNLASHALGLNARAFSWLYADPDGEVGDELTALFAGEREVKRRLADDDIHINDTDNATKKRARDIAESLRQRRIACIGEHPPGFDTCAYSPDEVKDLSGVTVDKLHLDELFDAARNADDDETAAARRTAEAELHGLSEVDQDQLTRSLQLKVGLDSLRRRGAYDAFAVRCWPETFTEYGGALCGPVSMLGEARVPCACEADVYGALTQLVLQEVAGAPVCLSDLVDLDVADDSGVVWHCGQAPVSMRDPDADAAATIHTNRRMPLLYEFPLRPGDITFMRISQSRRKPKMVIGFGEMLRRPMAFTGTSGVVRFARGASAVLHDIIDAGLEHHMAFAYGDHREVLREVAKAMELPVLEI